MDNLIFKKTTNLKKKVCCHVLFTRHCVRPLRIFQEARAEDLGGRNCPFMTALERSRRSLSNEVVRVLIRYEVWFWWRFSFLSLSLYLPWKTCCPIKKIHVVLLFCLCIWFIRFTFDFMIFVLISFVKFKFLFDFTLNWNIIFPLILS